MLIRWPAWLTSVVVALLFWSVAAAAHDLILTTESEPGFWHLIDAAQAGKLGNDITNANVGASYEKVRIELVRKSGERALLYLTRKSSKQRLSRYFDIQIGAGATASDAAQIGKALDAAFLDDPFEEPFDYFGALSSAALPTLADAWKNGGWSRALRVLEGRLITPAGVGYTAAVIIAAASAVLAGLILLWGSEP